MMPSAPAKTAADILPILQRWQDVLCGLDEALDPLRIATDMAPECKLNTAIDAAVGLCNQWAAERIGCSPESLEWWAWENEFGAVAHQAGYPDAGFPLRPMRTLGDYADLLAWELSRP